MKCKLKLNQWLIGLGIASSAIAVSTASIAQSSFFFPSASFFSPAAAFYQSEDGILEILGMIEEHQDFYHKLEQSDLLDQLPQDSVTILAPTNEAFAALSPALVKKLSEPENLTRLIEYHIVPGIIGEKDIQRREVTTLLDHSSVQITGIPLEGNKVGVKLNQALASDPISANNGVIIPINQVLIPPGF